MQHCQPSRLQNNVLFTNPLTEYRQYRLPRTHKNVDRQLHKLKNNFGVRLALSITSHNPYRLRDGLPFYSRY